ncbi:HD domain-containing protein [Thermobrachium celere]|uniref:HD domain-containing protein n=1 Tax=Thermobrachium celere TaxID=53422 RepID=UPI0019452AC1|nr:HD domain-containing protein [Thermobrachium celere]GFR36594.1 HD family phosphohydrolase [Thermobrachium celere]
MYRIRQFFWALFSKLTDDDKKFVNAYLSENERVLFNRLKESEKVHSVKVAKEVLERSLELDLYDINLIKAALLHDIGKVDSGLNVINKSIITIFNKLFPNFLKRFYNIRPIYAYYNHPEIALTYLNNCDNYIKFLIKNHHNYGINDKKLKILQEVDCKH